MSLLRHFSPFDFRACHLTYSGSRITASRVLEAFQNVCSAVCRLISPANMSLEVGLPNAKVWTPGLHQALGKANPANGLSRLRHFDFDVPSPEAKMEEMRLKIPSDVKKDIVLPAAEKAWAQFLELVEVAKDQMTSAEPVHVASESFPGDEVVVTTLGTGSAYPSSYRNGGQSSLHLDPLSFD